MVGGRMSPPACLSLRRRSARAGHFGEPRERARQCPVERFMPNLFPLHVPFTGTPLIVTMGMQQTYLCSEKARSPLVGQLPCTRLPFVSAPASAPGGRVFNCVD